jgi:hypothetical protein
MIETDRRIPHTTDLRTLFLSRANRRVQKLNARRMFPSFRWEVVREGRRYSVVAFQNVAEPADFA